MRILGVLLTSVVVLAGAAVDAASQDRRPPVEVSVGVSGLNTTPYEDYFLNDFASPAFDFRGTVPATSKVAVEGAFTVGQRSNSYSSRTEGLYLIQVKQRLQSATRGRFHAFLTYGAAGYHSRVTLKPGPTTFPDGSKGYFNGSRYTETDAPLAILVGGGVQHAIGSHAAVRADVQLATLLFLPLGTRFSAGLVIPLGKY